MKAPLLSQQNNLSRGQAAEHLEFLSLQNEMHRLVSELQGKGAAILELQGSLSDSEGEVSRLSIELKEREHLVGNLQNSLSGSSEELERNSLEVIAPIFFLGRMVLFQRFLEGKWGRRDHRSVCHCVWCCFTVQQSIQTFFHCL